MRQISRFHLYLVLHCVIKRFSSAVGLSPTEQVGTTAEPIQSHRGVMADASLSVSLEKV